MTAEILSTPAGAIEVETHGNGTPVLIVHGSPGGIDGARIMCRFLPIDKFKSICVSRPGYLNTPLHPTNPSIDQEADLIAAALTQLGIKKCAVLSWSGGGAVGYRLAVRHPELISCIVAIAALSSRWFAPKPDIADRFLFGTGLGESLVRYLTAKQPERFIRGALAHEGSVRGEELEQLARQVMADPQQRQVVLDIAPTTNIGSKRQAGWRNDVTNFAAIESLELERVTCPVMLVHGTADTDAVFSYSKDAHDALPNSILVAMDQGTHLSFYAHYDAPKVQSEACQWLMENST